MKKPRLDIKLNHPVNFRTNEDMYKKFTRKCDENNQFNQDRINLLIAADLGMSISFKTNPENETLFESIDKFMASEESSSAGA